MPALIDNLALRPDSDVVWYAPQGGARRAAELSAAIRRLPLRGWHGRRIALGPMPVEELAIALIALDGLAATILLLPGEDSEQARQQRLDSANIDVVLEAGTFALGAPPATQADGEPGAAFDTTWLLPTSGTTGTPKLIAHSLASLTRSMSQRRIGAAHVWGSLYSLRRFAGLQVFLQCWLAGTPLILQDEGADLAVVLANLIGHNCTALSGTPSMWRKLSMHPLFDELDIRQVTLGGEIVDQAVLDMLARRKAVARVTHIYASTEAGVGFAVRDGRAGFPRSYLDTPAAGVRMRVGADMNLLFQAVDPAAPGEAGQDWLDSGDVVRMEQDRVYFVGRANGSINVGGNKVMPEEVEGVIDELPEVAFVEVRARKSAMLGSLVEAAVMPAAGVVLDAVLKKKIMAHCKARLEGFKVPAFIVEAREITVTASGKLTRGSAQ